MGGPKRAEMIQRANGRTSVRKSSSTAPCRRQRRPPRSGGERTARSVLRADESRALSGADRDRSRANAEALVGAVARRRGRRGDAVHAEMSGLLDRDGIAQPRSAPEADDRCSPRCARCGRGRALGPSGLAGLLAEDGDKLANRGFVIDGQGEIRARRQNHLFDVDLPTARAGANPPHIAAASGRSWWRLLPECSAFRSATICASRSLSALSNAGATVLAIRQPSRADWRGALACADAGTGDRGGRLRGAAAQCGTHEDGRETYGHSLVVGPWGRALDMGGEETGIGFAELDPRASRRSAPACRRSATAGRFRCRR